MSYRIIVNPLPELLPELAAVPVGFQDRDVAPSRRLLREFASMQDDKLGHRETYGPKHYAMADKILEKLDYKVAYEAAVEYWSLNADNRRSSNFQEFTYRVEEMANRALEDSEETRRQERLAKRRKQPSRREWLQGIIDNPDSDDDRQWATEELERLDDGE